MLHCLEKCDLSLEQEVSGLVSGQIFKQEPGEICNGESRHLIYASRYHQKTCIVHYVPDVV